MCFSASAFHHQAPATLDQTSSSHSCSDDSYGGWVLNLTLPLTLVIRASYGDWVPTLTLTLVIRYSYGDWVLTLTLTLAIRASYGDWVLTLTLALTLTLPLVIRASYGS